MFSTLTRNDHRTFLCILDIRSSILGPNASSPDWHFLFLLSFSITSFHTHFIIRNHSSIRRHVNVWSCERVFKCTRKQQNIRKCRTEIAACTKFQEFWKLSLPKALLSVRKQGESSRRKYFISVCTADTQITLFVVLVCADSSLALSFVRIS
jgi:hypothetical protein